MSEEKLSAQELKIQKLKSFYKTQSLEKLKDILSTFKRKSQRYKDLDQSVPKEVISLQRILAFMIKAKQKERLEKVTDAHSTIVKEDLAIMDYEALRDIISDRMESPPILDTKDSDWYNAIDVWMINEKDSIYIKTLQNTNNVEVFQRITTKSGKIKDKTLKIAKNELELPKVLYYAKRKMR